MKTPHELPVSIASERCIMCLEKCEPCTAAPTRLQSSCVRTFNVPVNAISFRAERNRKMFAVKTRLCVERQILRCRLDLPAASLGSMVRGSWRTAEVKQWL